MWHGSDRRGGIPTRLTLGEAIENLSEALVRTVTSELDPRRAVHLAPDSDPKDPYELEIALFRSGLKLRPSAGRLEVLARGAAA